jgi:hypothetical protein
MILREEWDQTRVELDNLVSRIKTISVIHIRAFEAAAHTFVLKPSLLDQCISIATRPNG